MPPNPRVAQAFQAMKSVGFAEDEVKPALKSLLKLYDKNWELIEMDNYRVLVDAIFENEESEQLKAALHSGKSLKEHVNFLSENVNIFRQETPHDILVKSGQDNEPPIPAHRAILRSKSQILKDMLIDSSSDSCKAPSTPNETLTFAELKHDELKILLDFIYSGGFEYEAKYMEHASSLLVAAEKYDIPSLKDYYEAVMVANLNESNVVRFLEISEISGNTKVKDAAMDFIERNNFVIYRSKFKDFTTKYPLLSLDITRACVMQEKLKQRRLSVPEK